MGRLYYILPVKDDQQKQHILNTIKAHNTYDDAFTEEQIYDPNFKHEVGEELIDIVYVKLLKSRPKYVAEYTHAIICGNGGGSIKTFEWFEKHQVKYILFQPSRRWWMSSKVSLCFGGCFPKCKECK